MRRVIYKYTNIHNGKVYIYRGYKWKYYGADS